MQANSSTNLHTANHSLVIRKKNRKSIDLDADIQQFYMRKSDAMNWAVLIYQHLCLFIYLNPSAGLL